MKVFKTLLIPLLAYIALFGFIHLIKSRQPKKPITYDYYINVKDSNVFVYDESDKLIKTGILDSLDVIIINDNLQKMIKVDINEYLLLLKTRLGFLDDCFDDEHLNKKFLIEIQKERDEVKAKIKRYDYEK